MCAMQRALLTSRGCWAEASREFDVSASVKTTGAVGCVADRKPEAVHARPQRVVCVRGPLGQGTRHRPPCKLPTAAWGLAGANRAISDIGAAWHRPLKKLRIPCALSPGIEVLGIIDALPFSGDINATSDPAVTLGRKELRPARGRWHGQSLRCPVPLRRSKSVPSRVLSKPSCGDGGPVYAES
jgi:hypothetical protein